MAVRKTKTVEDYEKELADERAKWDEKRKSIESKITEVKKQQKKEEAAAKAKAAQAIGEEVLASLGDWKRIDFDALSLALAEIPGLVPDNDEWTPRPMRPSPASTRTSCAFIPKNSAFSPVDARRGWFR